VVAVADHIANGTDISVENIHSYEARDFLEKQGFSIETKQQEKFELSITAENIEATDERFTMDNLFVGDDYKPLDVYFKKANGDIVKRAYSKGERRNSNQTLPRLACQIYEKQLAALSVEEKENFPICKYNPDSDMICGIFSSVDEYRKHRNTIEYSIYGYDNGRQFVIYSWNIFRLLFSFKNPGYRGRAGEISTQYANLHSDPDEKFYIPENVYIIGTMNDIDRSVDSFDFAMRRRFRFVELRADERLEMLATLEDEELEAEAIRRMSALNKAIADVEDLNENYQIGASYFLKLKTLDFDQLWTDYLEPLLHEYVQGMYDEEGLMNRFARAYGYQKPAEGGADEGTQNQG